MSMEMAGGELSFAEAAARCPFLQSLGEQALAEIEVEYEALRQVADTAVEQSTPDTQSDPVVLPAKTEVPGVELSAAEPRTVTELDSMPARLIGAEERTATPEPAVGLLPPETMWPVPLADDGGRGAALRAHDLHRERVPQIELEPATPEGYPESTSVAAKPFPEIVRTPVVTTEETAGALPVSLVVAAQPLERFKESEANERPAVRLGQAEPATEPEAAAARSMLLEVLLAEPVILTETAPQPALGSTGAVEMSPEVLPFSAQLGALVAAEIEPEQQPVIQEYIAAVYEMVEQVIETLETTEAIPSLAEDTPEEMVEAVTAVLWALGLAEPTRQQVAQFIEFVEQEIAISTAVTTVAVLDPFHERLQGLRSPRWFLPVLGPFRVHRCLARLALA